MSLIESNHLAISASTTGTHSADLESPTETGVSTRDDRPWPAEREEITVSVSSATANRAWFKQWLEDAFALFNLPPNWNGYGERRVHASSIKRAARALDAMDYDGPGPALSPRHDGSVQVEWHHGSRSVELIVPPNGPAEGWVFGDGDERSWSIESTGDARRLAAEVRALLKADD